MSPAQLKTNNEIEAFLTLLRDGIAKWEVAGVMLSTMRKHNPSIYAEIIRREPMITVDMLSTIERIGRKQLHPRLLLNAQLPVKRLMGFPYEEQARLCSEPVDVVVKIVGGKPRIEKKLVRDMSRPELGRVLDTHRVKTVQEQADEWEQPEGNEEWQKMDAKPAASKLAAIAKMDKPAEPIIAPPPVPVNLVTVGRWVIRKGIGNNCGFERTTATPPDILRIVLEDGVKVIEVCTRK